MSDLQQPAHFYVLDPRNTSSPPKKASYNDIMVGRIYALLPGIGKSSWVTVVEKSDTMFKIKGIDKTNQEKLNSLFGGMGENTLGMKYSFDGIPSLSKENFEKLIGDNTKGFWIYAAPPAASPAATSFGGKRSKSKKTRKATRKTRKGRKATRKH